ncbi:MAG: YqaJ viral recombinase family protein [Alphaproteobacteria bacterium]|nr:YqaJ viral recombinase family protein [Alphaproteobacteria bacterium]
MSKYFECNLPKTAPKYIQNPLKRIQVTRILKAVHKRMNKLQEALEISGMPGEQFALGAKIFFDRLDEDGKSIIDSWTSEELAMNVKTIANNMAYEPRFEWKNSVVVVDTAFISIPEWEICRIIGIGGSDAAVTMGLSPYRTEQQVYHDKIGTEIKIEDKKDKGKQFIFSYGHKVESLVIEEFCRRTGAKVIPETRMFCKKDMPFITANIDAIVIFPDGRIFVFEAKTTTEFNQKAWENGAVPVQYIPQCRQYPSVLDDERIAGTYIGCIYGNTPDDFKCSYVERNKTLEEEQLEIEKTFWEEHILAGVEPEPSGNPEADIKVLRTAKVGYADKSLKPVDLESTYKEIIDEYMRLDLERKSLDKKSEGLKERQQQLSLELMLRLGKSTKGVLPAEPGEHYEVSWGPRSSTTFDREKLRLKYPDVYDDIVSVNPEASRSFSIKIKKDPRKKAV